MEEGINYYLTEIGKMPILSKEEEYSLFERLRSGEESVREEIVSRNLRLVVRLALRFRNKGVNIEDLIQEGNIGLIEVINKFDHTLGYRFSTYAAFWIRQAMQVAVRKQGAMIRLPVRKARQLGQIAEIVHEWQSIRGRMPSHEEVAGRLGLDEEQVRDLMQLSNTALSLDAASDETGLSLSDLLADVDAPAPSEVSMEREMTRKVAGVLQHLTDRESIVIKLRFGLSDQRRRSLRKVSRMVGLSQEGVRRVEKRALDKLRRNHVRSQLAGLL